MYIWRLYETLPVLEEYRSVQFGAKGVDVAASYAISGEVQVCRLNASIYLIDSEGRVEVFSWRSLSCSSLPFSLLDKGLYFPYRGHLCSISEEMYCQYDIHTGNLVDQIGSQATTSRSENKRVVVTENWISILLLYDDNTFYTGLNMLSRMFMGCVN